MHNCYLNSVLQALLSLPSFRHLLVSSSAHNPQSSYKGRIAGGSKQLVNDY